MPGLADEIRYSCRLLLRNPVFSIVTLLTIALGTGAAVAIFSVVNSTLLSPLPYEDPERLVTVWWASPQSDRVPTSLSDLEDWRQESTSFDQLGGYHPWSFTLTGDGEAERISGAVVTRHVFELLGVRPQLGQIFDADGPDAPATVILSDQLWKRRFGGAADVLGQKLILDAQPFEVIGVMPPDFRFPPARPAELWKANSFKPGDFPRDVRYLRVLGVLKPDVSVETARTEMAAVAARHEQQYPDSNTGLGTAVVPLHETVVTDFRQALVFLQLAVLLALAIACFNVAILQLARAAARRNEIAVRLALGGGRFRLFRQFLTESLVLGLCGGTLGLAFAGWAVRLLIRSAPQDIPRLAETAIDFQVLAFALAVTLGASLIFGLAPAFYTGRFSQTLREGTRSSPGTTWVRQMFVFLQVAVTLVLLVAAGLMIRSFGHLSSVSPGFRADDVLTLRVHLPESKSTIEQTSAFYRELKERVEGLAGVESFATCMSLPFGNGMDVDNDFDVESRPWTPGEPKRNAQVRPVSPGYFGTLGIPLVSGRVFSEQDRAGTQGVALVNQELARRYWAGADPVGERILTRLDFGPSVGRLVGESWEVVGVVGDVRHGSLEEPVKPEIYFSTLQNPWMVTNLVVRTASDPAALAKPIAAQIHAMEPDLPVLGVRTLAEIVAGSLGQPRFNAWLVSGFALFALVLTATGLYGLLSYSVTQRSREIGLRMALGAKREDVVRLVVSRGMAVASAGLVAGLVGALLGTRLLAGLLFGVSSTDPVTFVGVSSALALVAFAASYLPARRAARLDPVTTLRYE